MDEFDALELREAFHGWLSMDVSRRARTGSAIRDLLEAQLPGGVEAVAMDAARHGDHEDALRTFDRFLALSPEAREGAEGRELAALLKAWLGPEPAETVHPQEEPREQPQKEEGTPPGPEELNAGEEVDPVEVEPPLVEVEPPLVEVEKPLVEVEKPLVEVEPLIDEEIPPAEQDAPLAVDDALVPLPEPGMTEGGEEGVVGTGMIPGPWQNVRANLRSRLGEGQIPLVLLVLPLVAALLLAACTVSLRRRRKRNRLLRRAALHRQRRKEYLAAQQRQSVTPRGSIYS